VSQTRYVVGTVPVELRVLVGKELSARDGDHRVWIARADIEREEGVDSARTAAGAARQRRRPLERRDDEEDRGEAHRRKKDRERAHARVPL